MLAPALIYVALIPAGPWSHGWGVPMATDTAFAVALIAMMGARVPVELRIFLTAAAIVDDIGAIVVVALFYSDELRPRRARAPPRSSPSALALLNRWRVYAVTPYALLGVALWFCVHEGGLHATLAGVVLALFIPTRPPADLTALVAQANAHPDRRGAAQRRGAARRPVAAGAARARRDPRPARVAGRPAAAPRRRPVELPGAAGLRAGQRRGGAGARGARGARRR